MQALTRFIDLRGQFFEADGGVDQIAQDSLAPGRVAPQIRS